MMPHTAAQPPFMLYGYHAVSAALRNPERQIKTLYITRNMAHRLEQDRTPLSLDTRAVDIKTLNRLVGKDAVHQGIALECMALEQPTLEDVRRHNLVVALDQITDPHNVGAIMRSACALGAGAIVTTWRHAPHESGLLAKTASGAFEHIAYIQVTNLARALTEMRHLGLTTIGLDSAAPAPFEPSLFEHAPSQIALVLGAEGKGLRRLTRDTCTHLARLDMPGPIKSLNVSNAAALALSLCRELLSS